MVVVLGLNKTGMKAITINASEQEIWEWKARAVGERKGFGEWVRGQLNTAIWKPVKPEKVEKPERTEVKQGQELRKPDIQKGVEAPISVPANTVDEAKERVAEMEAKKAAELKRLKEAGKAMETRYGK